MFEKDIYSDLRPIAGEKRYVDFDPDFDCWAVFGEDSGFCYSQHPTYEEAMKQIKEDEKNE